MLKVFQAFNMQRSKEKVAGQPSCSSAMLAVWLLPFLSNMAAPYGNHSHSLHHIDEIKYRYLLNVYLYM